MKRKPAGRQATPRPAAKRRSDRYSPELAAHVARVMQQRQTCIDQLMRAASDAMTPQSERIKASTMMLQATAEYVGLDKELHATTAHADPEPEAA